MTQLQASRARSAASRERAQCDGVSYLSAILKAVLECISFELTKEQRLHRATVGLTSR